MKIIVFNLHKNKYSVRYQRMAITLKLFPRNSYMPGCRHVLNSTSKERNTCWTKQHLFKLVLTYSFSENTTVTMKLDFSVSQEFMELMILKFTKICKDKYLWNNVKVGLKVLMLIRTGFGNRLPFHSLII